MLKARQQTALIVLGLALVASVVAYVVTNGPTTGPANGDSQAAGQSSGALVDLRSLQTAQRLAALATTPAEQDLAKEALRLGDHAVDLAFAIALNEAADHPVTQTPAMQQIAARVQSGERLIEGDQRRIAQLTAQQSKAGELIKDSLAAQLELTKAQLELHQDELGDAKSDLLRAGGDPEGRIHQMVTEHHAAAAPAESLVARSGPAALATGSGLIARVEDWSGAREKVKRLRAAGQETALVLGDITKKRSEVAQHIAEGQAALKSGGATSQLSTTKHLSADQKELAELDQRIRDQAELLDVYSRWGSLAALQQRQVLHDILLKVTWILLIALAAVAIGVWLDRFFTRLTPERTRLRTLRTVARFAVQGIGLVAAALILFGQPSQLATILGLAGAGLTVVLKDFIVGFFGWFALMGRNGIRLGDWVEINGVSGEVIEITLFHTVLLETGNWTDAGHPTGRRVTFNNGFAIEGHYFNFSTSGQWLWDEIELVLPPEQAQTIIDAIRELITRETSENSRQAELEWGRVTEARAVGGFTAKPALDIRPGAGGTHVLVRYITRASERHQVRTRLYQAVVELMGKAAPGHPTVA